MTRISFEFFPPRDEAALGSLVENVVPKLAAAQHSFFSVTYGAGGSTRAGTTDTIRRLMSAGHQAAPHLSIGADDIDHIKKILDEYHALGVQRLVALRGDVPSGIGRVAMRANAQQLIEWVRKLHGDHFLIEVAAYPEVHPDADSAEADFEFFRRKVDAGADSAITQYFFNPYAYYDFVERCARGGVNVPVHAGIMPVTNFDAIVRFSQNCGADIPRWMRRRMEELDEPALRDFAVEWLSRMCEDLIGFGAPGFHFYTLNRWGATTRILANLGLL